MRNSAPVASTLRARLAAVSARPSTDAATLVSLTSDMLRAAGMPSAPAAQAAALLVAPQQLGIDSHGLAHLPAYLARIKSGAIDAAATPNVQRTGPSSAIVDGCNALGVLVAAAALDEAAGLARASGVGVVAVRDSNHFGAAFPLVAAQAREGLVALAFSNAAPTMAPWGGRDPVLGTNPLAAAFPRPNGAPVVIDMATSAVARGRIRNAARTGSRIPLNWALDAEGRATDDPELALSGTMQPMGGAKGYSLALMVELLCTSLSGGRPGFEVRNPHAQGPEPAGTSHLVMVFDPRRFAGEPAAEAAVRAVADRIEGAACVDTMVPPRLPGARAAREAAARARDGIPLTPTLLAHLTEALALVPGTATD